MSIVSFQRISMSRPLLLLAFSLFVFIGAVLGRLAFDRAGSGKPGAATLSRPQFALSTEAVIARMQERLAQNSDDAYAYAQLGLALLQQVRENGDASLYMRAEKAFEEALRREPQYLDALIGQGILALARHDFAGAIEWATQARAINPFRAEILGILVDAQVELGRYDEAVETLQKMVDMRPDLNSYSRVSYLRELHGDVEGAIAAMQAAVDAGAPGAESTLWAQVYLGHLYFNAGDWPRAEEQYRAALRDRPNYVHATAGLARVWAAQGEHTKAVEILAPVVERLPLPEYIIALGELYEATGQLDKARRQYELVNVIQQLNASAGMNVGLEMALFNADHGADPAIAEEQARAAYAQRPTIYAADVLSWALYRNGEFDEAQIYSQEALRLGARDARLYFHAGMIACVGQDVAAARRYLSEALAINPGFSVLYAPQAQATLANVDSCSAAR